ncbi:hypothetical protein N7540_012714 [Penicillium herquei]|nr:hypothetical protein N7540_012714 [Penicillium herquei]
MALIIKEVSHLFGQDIINTMNPSNGLLHHEVVETAWNKGDFIIIPNDFNNEQSVLSRWRCALINERI